MQIAQCNTLMLRSLYASANIAYDEKALTLLSRFEASFIAYLGDA